MYVLDPLLNIKTADKDLDELQSMTKFIQNKLTEMQAKETTKSQSTADPELADKVKKGLKGKRYKDTATGVELSFGTAYARGNAQAKEDFNKGMDKARSKKETGGAGSQKDKGEQKEEKQAPKKSISEIDPIKTKDNAKKLLKALRGHDKAKALEELKQIEQGSERGTLDAIIELLSQPELQQALGMQRPVGSKAPPKQKAPVKKEQPKVTDQSKQVEPKQTKQDQSKPQEKQPKQDQSKAQEQTQPQEQTKVEPPPVQAPPPVVETGVSAKPRLDMNRVNEWAKKNKVPFNSKSFEKHLKSLDVDMDEKELNDFMESYTNTVKKEQSHSDYKKYRDVDLSKIKDPKELAKAMAIKKEAEFHFNPLNGLGLENLTTMNKQDIEEHKEWIREAEKERYAKMPAEDRKEMGNKLKAEIDKLDPFKDKEKIDVLESAYEGLLASAMFENNEDEMQELFDADPTEGMSPNEKKEYKEKQDAKRKEKQDKREKEISNLEKMNMPLNDKEKKKREENSKKITENKQKSQSIGNSILEIQQAISKTKDQKELEKLNEELLKQQSAKEKIEKETAKIEQNDYRLALRDEESLLKDVASYEEVKAELETLKEKLLKSQSNPKVKKEDLAKDQIAYKKLLEKKEKAITAQSALNERKNTANKIQSLKDETKKEIEQEENKKLLDGSKVRFKQMQWFELKKKITTLKIKKEKDGKLSEKEETELQKLAGDLTIASDELKKLEEKARKLQDKEFIKTKRYPVNKDIVAMVQTMDNPKVLGALMQMTKIKEQGEYKENLKTIFKSVSDEDLMSVVENTSVGEMAKLLGADYCPQDVANKSKDRDDDDNKCNVTLSYAQKQEAREHILDFISNEMFFTNADKGKTKAKPTKMDIEEKDDVSEMAKEIEKREEQAKEKAKEEQKAKEKEEKEQVKKHQEEIKKYTKNFEDALLIHDEKKRVERIKQITTDLNLAKASQATRDERSKAMIDAIRKIPDPKKRQEYLELLQNNDSDPPIFQKTRLGTDKNFNKVFINNNNNSKGLDFNMKKKSTTITNYQEIANTFRIGMKVFPFYGGSKDHHGTVVAIYPAIGMVDVQFPFGSSRYPVEDLQIADLDIEPVQYDSIPGGLGTKPVNAKTALYWADKDRKYRMCRDELKPTCPRCKGVELKKTIYKRVGGKSERLLCCPECLFLIKTTDILGFN